jgi:Family of unknown function (DUF6152)
MKVSLNRVALLAIGVVIAWPAASHHSTSMYDKAHPLTLEGTVKAMQWRNPHVTFDFVTDAKPDQPARTWTVEGSTPGVMTRSGWTKRSLNTGDRVQVLLAPLRNGKPGGLVLQKVTLLATGQVLTWKNLETELAGAE